MEGQYQFIADVLDNFLRSQAEPMDLTTVEQTIDRCRQLEHNLKQVRAMLRLQKVRESIMSEDEWHDADDGNIQLDPETINEFQKVYLLIFIIFIAMQFQDFEISQLEESKKQEALKKSESSDPFCQEILSFTAKQVKFLKLGVDKDVWELFYEDIAMKAYKGEIKNENGLMVNSLRVVHTMKVDQYLYFIHMLN